MGVLLSSLRLSVLPGNIVGLRRRRLSILAVLRDSGLVLNHLCWCRYSGLDRNLLLQQLLGRWQVLWRLHLRERLHSSGRLRLERRWLRYWRLGLLWNLPLGLNALLIWLWWWWLLLRWLLLRWLLLRWLLLWWWWLLLLRRLQLLVLWM